MTPTYSYEDLAWFRAKRTGLVTGFPDLAAAARAIVGAQAQIEQPARWALALRTEGTPTAAAVSEALLQSRSLVRAWGQRDTVHLYAADTWHLIAQGQSLWPASARTGPMATPREIEDFVIQINALDAPFTRSDLIGLAPGRLVDAFRATPVNEDPPERMAITRLIWAAGREGHLSSVHTVGREQAYAARATWLPDLPWPTMSPTDATLAVIRMYLRAWGPARATDIAHHLGARVGDVRQWLAMMADTLTTVRVGDRDDYLMATEDREAFVEDRPPTSHGWPARLLPAYDTQMMAHADKDAVLESADDRKRIWDKAAIVRPTIFRRGRFVATWSHKATRKAVSLGADVLTGGNHPNVAADIADALARDGRAFADHLGVAELRTP